MTLERVLRLEAEAVSADPALASPQLRCLMEREPNRFGIAVAFVSEQSEILLGSLGGLGSARPSTGNAYKPGEWA